MDKAESFKIRKQILAIRDTGKTNMFDAKTVQVMANDRGFYELVVFIEENLGAYSHFIITGDLPGLSDKEGKAMEAEEGKNDKRRIGIFKGEQFCTSDEVWEELDKEVEALFEESTNENIDPDMRDAEKYHIDTECEESCDTNSKGNSQSYESSNPKMEAFKRLDAIVAGYSPIENPEEELEKAREEKYGE